MKLRRAALALGSLALAGTLAACDLPGGTPPTISVDVEPNNLQVDAREVFVPQTLRGTFDASGNDNTDWYLLKAPALEQNLVVSCEGGPFSFRIVEGQNEYPANCEGGAQTVEIPNVTPDEEVFVKVSSAMTPLPLVPYAVKVRYTPAGEL